MFSDTKRYLVLESCKYGFIRLSELQELIVLKNLERIPYSWLQDGDRSIGWSHRLKNYVLTAVSRLSKMD